MRIFALIVLFTIITYAVGYVVTFLILVIQHRSKSLSDRYGDGVLAEWYILQWSPVFWFLFWPIQFREKFFPTDVDNVK